MKTYKKAGIQAVIYLLLLIMGFEQPLLATGQILPAANIPNAPSAEKEILPIVPPKWGHVQKVFKGKSPFFVIHIQDAHLNLEAQQNIARLVHYFVSKTGLDRVYLEGASGELSHRPLSVYPNAKARRLVGEAYLRTGMLSGPEYAALVKHPELVLYGIETPALYEKNRAAFLEALEYQAQNQPFLNLLRRRAEAISRFAFSQELREFFKYYESFRKDKTSLVEYVQFLNRIREQLSVTKKYPQLKHLETLLEMKSEDLDKKKNLSLEIFDEIQNLENEIKEILSRTEEEKQLLKIFKVLEIWEQMIGFAMTHDDAAYFYANRSEFDAVQVLGKLRVFSLQYQFPAVGATAAAEKFGKDMFHFEQFYELALARDEALLKNTLDDIQNQGTEFSILVTGGFHTPHFEEVLQKKEISYCVIAPRMTQLPDAREEGLYVEAMRFESSPFFRFLKEVANHQQTFVNDPRFQLQPPRHLPSLSLLEEAMALETLPLSNLVERFPALDFMVRAEVDLSSKGIALEGSSNPKYSDLIQNQLQRTAEKKVASVYDKIHSAGTLVASQKTAGAFVTPYSNQDGFAFEAHWGPFRNSTERLKGLKKDHYLNTSDGQSLEVELLYEPAQVTAAHERIARVKSQDEEAPFQTSISKIFGRSEIRLVEQILALAANPKALPIGQLAAAEARFLKAESELKQLRSETRLAPNTSSLQSSALQAAIRAQDIMIQNALRDIDFSKRLIEFTRTREKISKKFESLRAQESTITHQLGSVSVIDEIETIRHEFNESATLLEAEVQEQLEELETLSRNVPARFTTSFQATRLKVSTVLDQELLATSAVIERLGELFQQKIQQLNAAPAPVVRPVVMIESEVPSVETEQPLPQEKDITPMAARQLIDTRLKEIKKIVARLLPQDSKWTKWLVQEAEELTALREEVEQGGARGDLQARQLAVRLAKISMIFFVLAAVNHFGLIAGAAFLVAAFAVRFGYQAGTLGNEWAHIIAGAISGHLPTKESLLGNIPMGQWIAGLLPNGSLGRRAYVNVPGLQQGKPVRNFIFQNSGWVFNLALFSGAAGFFASAIWGPFIVLSLAGSVPLSLSIFAALSVAVGTGFFLAFMDALQSDYGAVKTPGAACCGNYGGMLDQGNDEVVATQETPTLPAADSGEYEFLFPGVGAREVIEAAQDAGAPIFHSLDGQNVSTLDEEPAEKMSAEEFDDLIEEMSKIEVIRGEQADGEAEFLTDGTQLTDVVKRIVKTKRGKIPKGMRRAFRREMQLNRLTHFFVKPLSPQLKRPTVITKQGHSRFGTSSRPSVKETQPVRRPRWSMVWSLENGQYVVKKRKVATITSHNGDMDEFFLYGQWITYDVIRDQWAKKVLGKRNPAEGDTPRLGEVLDLVYNQGMFDASFRRAYQFKVARSLQDQAPSTKVLKEWGTLADGALASMMASGDIKMTPGDFANPQVRRNAVSLEERILQSLSSHPSFKQLVPEGLRPQFVQDAIEGFFKNDLHRAVQIVKKRSKGSFGMIVTSNLEPQRAIAVANLQPLSFAFYPKYNLLLWSSEAGALKVRFKAGGKETTMPFRFDLDQATGEIVKLEKITGQRKPRLMVYSEYHEKYLTPLEVAQSGRVIDMRNNALIDPLPSFDWDNLVGRDISEIAQIADRIKRNWQDKKSFNRQTGLGMFQFLVEKDISETIEAGINRKRLSKEIQQKVWSETSRLAKAFLDFNINEGELNQEIHGVVAQLLKEILAQEHLGVSFDEIEKAKEDQGRLTGLLAKLLDKVSYWVPLMPERDEVAETEAVDVLITGYEVSQWLGEQFAFDLHQMFPRWKIESVSSNKVLTALKKSNLKRNKGEFTIEEHNRSFRVGRKTIVLAISQSGQTFGTLNATIALSHILPGRVFALTGGIDTLMGQAVGQVYAKGAPFSKRIFDNLSGLRPAEPASVSVVAAHQTLTELLLYLGAETKRFYANRRRPLGLVYEKEDFQVLRNIRDEVVQDLPSLTGFSARGPLETVQSPVQTNLKKLAKRWGQHILEYPVITVFVAFLVSVLVYNNSPFFPHSFAWFPRPSWAVDFFLSGYLNIYTPLVNSVLNAFWFIPVGAAYFVAFSYPFVVGLRAAQGRPLFQRTGKRTLTIGALPFVHQILEMYVSKIFSLSYGFASLDVHGANPRDHFLARFAHRVVRGSLLLLFRPDGRLASQAGNQSAVDMTKSQAEGIESFKVGAEVWTVGRNPKTKASTSGDNILLPDIQTRVKVPVESFLRKMTEQLKLQPSQTTKLESLIENLAERYAGKPIWKVGQAIAQELELSSTQTEIFEEAFHDLSERQSKIEGFYDTRFDALQGMVTGFVVFADIGKHVSRFFRWVRLAYDMAASQSRARVFTTRSPVSAADIADIIEIMAEINKLENPSPQLSLYIQPEGMPFEVVTETPAPRRQVAPGVSVPVKQPLKKSEPAVASKVSVAEKLRQTTLRSILGPLEDLPYLTPKDQSALIKRTLQAAGQRTAFLSAIGITPAVFKTAVDAKIKEANEFDEPTLTIRSELRAASAPEGLLPALKSKTDFQRRAQLEQEIPFGILEKEAQEQGWNLQEALKQFTSYKTPYQQLVTNHKAVGEVVFVYRAQDHEASVKDFFRTVKAQQQIRQVTFVRDVQTTEAEWQALQTQVKKFILGPNLRADFAEGVGSGLMHQTVEARMRVLGLAWQQVIQLPDSPSSREDQAYYEALRLGAVPIANATLLVLGLRDEMEQARRIYASDIVDTIMALHAQQAIEASA